MLRAARTIRSVERDDHFVGTDQAELAADHFVGEIGIGAARIEQLGAMREPRALGVELRELDARSALAAGDNRPRRARRWTRTIA